MPVLPRSPPTKGKVISSRDVHPLNAPSPILVTLSGMVIEVKPVQPSNALTPISVTGYPPIVEGMVMLPFTDVSKYVIVASPLETV